MNRVFKPDLARSDSKIAALALVLALAGPSMGARIGVVSAQDPTSPTAADRENRPSKNSPYLARFTLGGEPAVVTRIEAARDVALRYRRGNEGKNVIQALVDAHLVRSEAAKLGVWPGRSTVEARLAQYREQVAATGRDLDAEILKRGFDQKSFSDLIATTIAHERIVREEAGLGANERVDKTALELWLREARARHRIEMAPEKLDDGVAAKVDEYQIDLIDVGIQLLRTLDVEERTKFARQIALRRLIDHEAKQRSLAVTPADMQAEIEKRQKRIEKDPGFRGAPYEQLLLQIRGRTIEEYKRSRELRGTVLLGKIAEQLFTVDELREHLDANREDVLARHGESRELSGILIYGTEEGRPRTLEESKELAEETAESLRKRRILFDKAARAVSDDEKSALRGGDLGRVTRGNKQIPKVLVDYAFKLELRRPSDPIPLVSEKGEPRGFALLMVREILPAPSDSVLIGLIREEKGQDWLEELFEAAKFEFID